MSHYAHKVKCLSCSLHFTAYSYHMEWTPKLCPECGGNSFIHWRESSSSFIYEMVPGFAEMVSINLKVSPPE